MVMKKKVPIQKGKLKPNQPGMQELSAKEKAASDKKNAVKKKSGTLLKKL